MPSCSFPKRGTFAEILKKFSSYSDDTANGPHYAALCALLGSDSSKHVRRSAIKASAFQPKTGGLMGLSRASAIQAVLVSPLKPRAATLAPEVNDTVMAVGLWDRS
jgi:hypothetical protein